MPQDPISLEAVLAAAEALLEARDNQMVTVVEWNDLQQAVDACRMPAGGD